MSALRLDDLLRAVATPAANDIMVSGLTLDSRSVRAGDAFVALAGAAHHGIEFASAAFERGAAAVIADTQGAGAAPGRQDARVVWVDGLRARLGAIAARFYGDPSAAMTVVGVTGTSGKTSTVQLLAQAFTLLGKRAATIGTLGAGLHGALRAGERTTPDVIRVHGLMAEFRAAGATDVAMEVSSHALDQHRVDGIHFDVAVFTNLTRDHLDYHKTMDAYFAAKAKLFAWPHLAAAVIDVDDAYGRRLLDQVAPGARVWRYGIDAADADVRATDVRLDADGIGFELATPWGRGRVHSRLLGRFNVANLLAVAGTLGALGVGFEDICAALAASAPVAGRMNRLGGGGAPLVVIDYSHKPDALEQALATLRAHCAGQLVCVFGCGGERDAGKRPLMGAIAERLADAVVVTDDNPRGEDGDAIVAQIVAGMHAPEHATVERDRARAIELAIARARAGDVVLVAGKGHETYQESRGVKRPFDDMQVARAALEARPC
jgi:UDP-N-acetylmuramoyl-L-alanyl-D-glutamate--2,6-diaminopimelate ligase